VQSTKVLQEPIRKLKKGRFYALPVEVPVPV